MISKSIRKTSLRIAAGSGAAVLVAFLSYRADFNLSSATSVQLCLVAAIALRWGLIEASAVSLLSVVCIR